LNNILDNNSKARTIINYDSSDVLRVSAKGISNIPGEIADKFGNLREGEQYSQGSGKEMDQVSIENEFAERKFAIAF
jgi:hypothetical protein